MIRTCTVLLSFFLTVGLQAQTTLGFQGFEGLASDTWSFTPTPAAFTPNSNGDYWGVANSIGTISPSASGGSSLWAVQDLDNGNGGASSGSLSFPAINTSGFSSFTISFDYNVFEFDNGDDIDAQVTIDGNPQSIESVVNGSSNFSTTGWQTYTFTWNPAATSISLEIFVSQNGQGDYGAIDNVTLTGVASSGCVISSVTIANQSACNDNATPGDNSDDFYTADLTVNFVNKPATGTLDLTGDISSSQSIAVGSTTTATSHTFTGVQIPANGASGDVTASFSAEPTCTRTENNLLPVVGSCSGGTDFLIFSEYIESGNQKYLEVHNPSTSPISLTDYQILIYANGATNPTTTINFTGASIPAGGYYVLEHNQATTPLGVTPDQTAFLGYNGNDAIVLSDNGVIRDAIGEIGNNPGSSWVSGSCDTQDQTLRKDAGLGDATADSNPNDAYAPASHWQFCTASIDYTNLGVGFVFPVELLTFEAIQTVSGRELQWVTGSEQDNAGFELYRTHQGNEEKIADIQGAGVSTRSKTYSFVDQDPLAGRILYTLVQVDLDGTKTLVARTEISSLADAGSAPLLSPNPVETTLQLTWTADQQEPGMITIFGLQGETLMKKELPRESGQAAVSIDLSDLPSGMYILKYSTPTSQSIQRFFKR